MIENKNPNFISCVVYERNQEKNILEFLENLISFMKNKFQNF